jgi:nucleoside 2-deoxyribosyltransferase
MSPEFAESGFKLPQRARFRYVGPFFVRDPESSDLKHNLVDPSDEHAASSSAETVRWCKEWIEQADAVFAWIDAPDVYGTLAEIGLAHTLGKPIFLAFSHDLPAGVIDDMWFAQQLAGTVRRGLTVEVAWQEFERWAGGAIER